MVSRVGRGSLWHLRAASKKRLRDSLPDSNFPASREGRREPSSLEKRLGNELFWGGSSRGAFWLQALKFGVAG